MFFFIDGFGVLFLWIVCIVNSYASRTGYTPIESGIFYYPSKNVTNKMQACLSRLLVITYGYDARLLKLLMGWGS